MLHDTILAARALRADGAVVDIGLPSNGLPPAMGEAAAPDVPAAIGWMIVGAYAAIMALFILTFARSPESAMVTVIAALYTGIYLAVPAIFLRQEPSAGRISMTEFLRQGMRTHTGKLSGGEAVAQILLIPFALAIAIGGISIVVALSR